MSDPLHPALAAPLTHTIMFVSIHLARTVAGFEPMSSLADIHSFLDDPCDYLTEDGFSFFEHNFVAIAIVPA